MDSQMISIDWVLQDRWQGKGCQKPPKGVQRKLTGTINLLKDKIGQWVQLSLQRQAAKGLPTGNGKDFRTRKGGSKPLTFPAYLMIWLFNDWRNYKADFLISRNNRTWTASSQLPLCVKPTYIPDNYQLSASQRRMVEKCLRTLPGRAQVQELPLFPATRDPQNSTGLFWPQCANLIVGKLNSRMIKQ